MSRRRRSAYYGGVGTYGRNKNFGNVFAKQLLISIIIVLFIILVKKMDVAIVNKQIDNLEVFLSRDMTGTELKNVATSSLEKLKNAPNAAVEAFKEGEAKMALGAPIDSVLNKKDKEFMVYSIGNGAISQVSENEKLGKFIRINHDNGMESIYGTMKNITVKESSKVKKGQIIGSIENKENNDLYFALLNKGKVVDPKDYIEF